MVDNQMVITLTLEDAVSTGLTKASKALDSFQKDLKTLGRELSQVGNTMAFFGAGVAAPFVVAMRKASETSLDLSNQFKVLDSITRQLNESVGRSLTPVIKTFNSTLNDLLNWFNSLNKTTRDTVIQTVFMSAVFVSFGGVLLSMVGKVISLTSNLAGLLGTFLGFVAVNPIILAIVPAIAGVLFLMYKFKPVADVVITTFEVMFLFVQNGLLTMKANFENTLAGMLETMTRFSDIIGKLPSVLGFVVRNFNDEIAEAARSLRSMAVDDMSLVLENSKRVGEALTTGAGEWSASFDGFKEKIEEIIGAIGRMGKASQDTTVTAKITFNQFVSGLQTGLGALGSSLQQAAAENKKFAEAARVVSLGLAIVTTAAGISRANQDYPWPFSMIVAGLVAAAGAIQIGTIASQKFAEGTDSVPSMLTPGEMVFPRSMADAIRAGDITVGGRGSSGGGDINISIFNPQFKDEQSVRDLSEMVGFEIERELRRARATT